ncbi:MAG: roadblock/LC7 domain-containing protein [Deltaproteobacteria bacterium]|nr:roadblock/LC7 domain-containing protein [Deltaproteobacteria bacterium]
MPLSREDQLNQVLRGLHSSTPDIEGAAIISMDGLIMASSLPANLEEDRISAMSAALYGIGSRTSEELDRGDVEQVYIKGKKGYLLITQAGNDAVLAVMANAKAKLGIIFLDVRRAAEEVGKIV